MNNRIAFVGAGRMAGSMVRGILKSGGARPEDITCTSAPDGTAEALASETGIGFTYDWPELLKEADWVVLACKPQQVEQLPSELGSLCADKRILSILAGTTSQRLSTVFPKAANIVRCMPNTPGMIGQGVTVYSPLYPLSGDEESQVRAMLGALGQVLTMPETALDAVTGLSGSGPAYVFEFVAALRDGGVAAGLDEDTAYQLALKTVQGAAALLEAVPETPETHRKWVSSPGGTTLAGLAVMEKANFREIMKDTVLAAKDRSRELSSLE